MTTPLPWIKVYGDLPTHRKSVTLAALLGDARAWTHVVELWLWVSRHAPEGDLGTMPDAAVAHVAGWRGDATAFVTALRTAGFLDGTHVHGWHEHNGAHFRKQAADKARNARVASEQKVTENPLTSESLVSREIHGSVESREYREDKVPENNLALFAPQKVAEASEKALANPSPNPSDKPRRGRPPKDRSPEAEAERAAEKADGDRWMTAARNLVGLSAEEAPWSSQLFMAFRQARKKRGIDQLMRALDGLAGDSWATKQGLMTLLSSSLIEKGLAAGNRRAQVVGIGFDETWDRYTKEAGLVEG